MNIKLLDCTLREAPIEGLIYGEDFIMDFIHATEKTNIEIIEVGFLKNGLHTPGSAIFQRVEEIQPYLKNKKQNVIYTVLVDYGRYDLAHLSAFNGKSIDGIRVCFKKGEQDAAIEYARQIKEKGYKVFVQHVDTIGYTEEEINDIVEKVNQLKPYAYAIVDTFGAMYQDDLQRIFDIVSDKLDEDITLGFHGHNNLLLANSNSQYFLSMAKQRKLVNIDASFLGCGRSAGNANTELLAVFLNKKYAKHYDFRQVLNIIDDLMPVFREKCQWGYKVRYAICAMNNTHTFNSNYLQEKYHVTSNQLLNLIGKIDNNKRNAYDFDLLDKLYHEETSGKNYKAIIFDLDGTLLNTSQGVLEAIKVTIRKLGLQMPSSEILQKFIGPRMQDSFEKYFHMNPEKALECANVFRENYKDSLFDATPYEGILDLLRNLKSNGFRIAIATNKSHDNAISILDKFGILKECDFAFGSDLEGKLTKTDIIIRCLKELRIAQNEALMVGDSSSDSFGAQQAEVDFVALTYGFGFKSASDLKDIKHIKICQDVQELTNFLLKRE